MNLVTFKENLVEKNQHKKKLKSKNNIFLEENYSTSLNKYNLDNTIEINKNKNYFKYICNIYETTLNNLVTSLNKYHKKKF